MGLHQHVSAGRLSWQHQTQLTRWSGTLRAAPHGPLSRPFSSSFSRWLDSASDGEPLLQFRHSAPAIASSSDALRGCDPLGCVGNSMSRALRYGLTGTCTVALGLDLRQTIVPPAAEGQGPPDPCPAPSATGTWAEVSGARPRAVLGATGSQCRGRPGLRALAPRVPSLPLLRRARLDAVYLRLPPQWVSSGVSRRSP